MNLEDTRTAAVAALRTYLNTEEGSEERTEALRETAAALVDARALILTRDGIPDWRGRTHAYRQHVREAMEEAGVPLDIRPTAQAAIRYHISALLRERVDAETLEDLGLRRETAKERGISYRRAARQRSSLVGAGAPIEDPAAIAEALRAVSLSLRRISPGALARAPEDVRDAAAEALDTAAERLSALLEVTK